MTEQASSERKTQNRVINLFADKARANCLSNRCLGEWNKHVNNRPIEATILRDNMTAHDYSGANFSLHSHDNLVLAIQESA